MTITTTMILATTQRDEAALRSARTAVFYRCPLLVSKWRRDGATISLQEDKEDNVGAPRREDYGWRTNEEEQEEGEPNKEKRARAISAGSL